jgi:uncharacterized protein YprB with RNaseH-like and TPR domain
LKTACFDLETTDLAAVGAGMLICAGIRPLATQRTRMFRIDAYDFEESPEYGFLEREETALLNDVINELKKYDLLIGHNIDKFDIPYLRSRAFQLHSPCEMWPLTYDTLKAFRRVGLRTVMNGFGKPSAGLGHVVDFFGIRQEKNGIYPVEHWRTIWGNESQRIEAMDHLVDHCQRDVRMNATIYPALLEQDTRVVIRRAL